MHLGLSHIEQKKTKGRFSLILPLKKISAFLIKLLILAVIVCFVFLLFTAVGMVRAVLDDTPPLTDLTALQSGYPSHIYDAEGNLIQEISSENRYRIDVSYEDLPDNLIQAFLCSEDPSFWTHSGIDLQSVFSDLFSKSAISENATITEQLVKNRILVSEYGDSFWNGWEDALQEYSLSLQLEEELSKEQILTDYLNTISLGNGCIGVGSAAETYFGKSVSDLTLSECVILAAAGQDPIDCDPVSSPKECQSSANSILSDLLSSKQISEEEYEEAAADNALSRLKSVFTLSDSFSVSSCFAEEVCKSVCRDLQENYHLTSSQAESLLCSGGLEIYSTMDSDIQSAADSEINDPSNYYDLSGTVFPDFSIRYSLTVQKTDGSTVTWNENDLVSYHKTMLDKPSFKNDFQTDSAMNEAIEAFKSFCLEDGDLIAEETIQKVPEPQAACLIMDPYTGQVLALSGGRGEEDADFIFNRASDSVRQPGSLLSVLTDYAPAIDIAGATLASTFYDSPFSLGDRQVMNWWGNQYLGYNNLRQGIKYSMNVVSAKCMTSLLTASASFRYAENFGITTLTDADRTTSLALGELSEGVTVLDITAAYSAIADDGIYREPVFYTRVLDRSGNVLLENTFEGTRIIKSTTAALLTEAMKDVISEEGIYSNYGIQPTGSSCIVEGMTVAGKSGTTSASTDLWFTGYSPYYVCTVWSGNDNASSLGTGLNYHKSIWQKIMTRIHEDLPDKAFEFSEPIEYFTICSKSGLLAVDGVCNCEGSNAVTYLEAFAPGTEPTEYCNRHYTLRICRESGQSASGYCPANQIVQKVYFKIDDSDLEQNVTTLDNSYLAPSALQSCSIHTAPAESSP